jgi:S1-C subfamily serine protease
VARFVQPWTANIIGLLLGFAIGGVALVAFLPVADKPEPVGPPAIASAQAAPPASARDAPPPVLRPVAMPRIAAAMPLPQPDALPSIIYPDPPPPTETHKPGTGVAGTGFFVASDGSLITAAHVVSGCRRTRIVSQLVKPATAELIATDEKHDIALLRAAHVAPPATLPVGRPAAPGGRLFVLGYPATGGQLIPTETWATLENEKFLPGPVEFTDPRRLIWAAAPVVNHGFSGGPMLDPRNGEVVGIVRGMVDSVHLHAVRAGIPASGMVIGPGSGVVAALLRQEGADRDTVSVSGDEALDTARRATVHVLCLY